MKQRNKLKVCSSTASSDHQTLPIVEAWFDVTFRSLISVVASEVDSSTQVSWMLLQCALRRRRPVPICRRGDERHTRTYNTTKPPFTTCTEWGTNNWQEEDAKSVHVRVQNRNVQPLYFNHCPGRPLINSIKPRSPSTRHRMRSAQFTAYSTTKPVHYVPCLSH